MQGISADYLFRKFKEVGEIQSIKITKDKQTQKPKGQAFITFLHPDSAEKAIKKFNNQIFILNKIKVKPYFNFHGADKKANILFQNLPEDADELELEQEFSRFGTVLQVDINRDQNGRQFNYGYVQFQSKEDAVNLIKKTQDHAFIYKDKILIFGQKQEESALIQLRAFAAPLSQELICQEIIVKSIEYGWQLVIKDYLIRVQGDEVKDCIVKIDQITRQPYAMIKFVTYDQAKKNLDWCEKLRKHPCFISNASDVFELIKKYGPPTNIDGSLSFTIQQIEPFFQQMSKDPLDTFRGDSDNFFWLSLCTKDIFKPDQRLIVVNNIKEQITKVEISGFLGQFGIIIRLNSNRYQNPIYQLQQVYVHYQTVEDSKRALSELNNSSKEKINNQIQEIFLNGQAIAYNLLSSDMNKELQIKKKQSYNIFTNPGQRQLLQPQIPHQQMIAFLRQNRQPQSHPPRLARYPFSPYKKSMQTSSTQITTTEPIKNIEKQQLSYFKEFKNYQTIQCRMEEFLQLPNDTQIQVLSNLLFQKVFNFVKNRESTKKIVDMLTDKSQFEIRDILNMFENDIELNSLIQEDLQLIHDEQIGN